jgi:hypothetical protein
MCVVAPQVASGGGYGGMGGGFGGTDNPQSRMQGKIVVEPGADDQK